MWAISGLQKRLTELDRQLRQFRYEAKKLEARKKQLGQLRKLPYSYRALEEELSRRSVFSGNFTAKESEAEKWLQQMIGEENTRRDQFQEDHGRYLPTRYIKEIPKHLDYH